MHIVIIIIANIIIIIIILIVFIVHFFVFFNNIWATSRLSKLHYKHNISYTFLDKNRDTLSSVLMRPSKIILS